MSAVTSERAHRELVDPSMDGIAANDYQAIALHNPATPEVDSLLERIDTLRSYNVPPAVVDDLRADVWLVVEWNGRERQCQRQVAGNSERIARDLHVRSALSVKGLARALRALLDAHENAPVGSPARLRAVRDIRWLLGPEPPASLENELSDGRTRQLARLLAEETR